MKNRLLSLLLAMVIGAILMWIVMQRNHVPSVTDLMEGKYKLIKQRELDSLTALVNAIEVDRHIDSLKVSNRLNANTVALHHYKDEIENIDFKEYTDPELDSLISRLYPEPGQ
jgi:hypothetical protein